MHTHARARAHTCMPACTYAGHAGMQAWVGRRVGPHGGGGAAGGSHRLRKAATCCSTTRSITRCSACAWERKRGWRWVRRETRRGAPGGGAASGAAASGAAASGALHTLTHTWSCRIDLSCISRTKCSSHVPGSRPSVRRQRVLRWLNRLVSVETAVTPQGGSSVTRLVYVSEKARKPSVSVASKLAGPWRAQMREAEQNGRNSVYRSTSATTA
jgi:hypothetical protein